MAQAVSYGSITIVDTTDIARIKNWYLASASSSGITISTSGWTDDPTSTNATMTATKQYLWNYEEIQGTGPNNTYITTNRTDPVIIGRYGQNGNNGKGITRIDEYYKANNNPDTHPTTWNAVNVIDTPTSTNRYLWNYQVIVYDDNTTEGSAEEARVIGVYGDPGAPGVNTATVYLYQRTGSTPAKPSGNLTYTFSSAQITSGTLGNWKQSIGELTGTNSIWVIAAVASSNGNTDTIASNEWSTPIKLAENGTAGLNQATIYIYKRANSVTTPSSTTYTFSNGSFTVPSGWSKYIPTSDGKPCYVTSAVAIGSGTTATLTWNTPSILVEDGTNGISPTVTSTSNGVKIVDADGNETYITNGTNGTSYYTYVRYSENSNGSNYVSVPTPSTIYIGVYSGTSDTPPGYNDSGWKWSRYVGNNGVSVTGTRELYYLKTNSADVPQITNSNQITATDRQNGWTSIVPTYMANTEYWTCIETSLSVGGPVWSLPILNQGLTDSNYNAYVANSIATHAQEDAEGALSQSATLDVKLKNFFWPGDSNYPGAYAVGKGTNDGLDVENISTYGYNLRLTPITLSIGYNQFKAIEIDGSNPALKFYKPSKTTQGAQTAQLDANGLVLSEGGIEAGNAGQSGFIYLSTENYGSNLTINGHQAPNWKEIIGTKFGVDADGNLYASNATISGAITATSLSTGTKTSETTGKGIFINSSGAIYSGDGNVNNFIINEYGAITAKSGTIGGWTIDSNSIHSSNKNVWDKDVDGIFIGNHTVEEELIFTISGGKIQYVEADETEVNPETTYYVLDGDTYIKVIDIEPTDNPRHKGWYKDLGPMWYINSDGSASFGSLLVNQTGSLNVPAASISGLLTANQIEVDTLWAGNTTIGATIDSDFTSNTIEANSKLVMLSTTDTRAIDGKDYYGTIYSYEEVNSDGYYQLTEDEEVVEGKNYYSKNSDGTYSRVSSPAGDPSLQGWYELVSPSKETYYEKILVNELEDYYPERSFLAKGDNAASGSIVITNFPSNEILISYRFLNNETIREHTFHYGYPETFSDSMSQVVVNIIYDGSKEFTIEGNLVGGAIINAEYETYILSNDIIANIEKTYYMLKEETSIITGAIVSPYASGYEEKIKQSYISLKTEKVDYILTKDSLVKENKSYYYYNYEYVFTKDTEVNKESIYYKTIKIKTDDVEPNDNKTYYYKNNSNNYIAIDWINNSSLYVLTEDTTIVAGKNYYIKNANDEYIIVSNPTGNPKEQNWYEYLDTLYEDKMQIVTPLELIGDNINPFENGWLEKVASYILVNNPSGNPQTNDYYEVQSIASAELVLENGNIFIKSNENTILSTDSSEGDINITSADILRDIGFGNILLMPFENGFIVQTKE